MPLPKRKKTVVSCVTACAFVMPIYDIASDEDGFLYIPAEREAYIEGYQVYVWDFETQEWRADKLFEDHQFLKARAYAWNYHLRESKRLEFKP